MNFPKGLQEELGWFAMVRARRWAADLEPIVGSPIETIFACTFMTVARECNGIEPLLVLTEEARESADRLYIFPQRRMLTYRVDFFISRPNGPHLIVECDGREFHHSTRDQIERDRARDKELEEAGNRVLRYPGTEIYNTPGYVASTVFGLADRESFSQFVMSHRKFLG